MRDRLTADEIETILQGYEAVPIPLRYLLHQVGFAGMALLGMKRHEKFTSDWYAHNELWASACNRIGQMLEPTPSGIGIGSAGEILIEKIKEAVGWAPQP